MLNIIDPLKAVNAAVPELADITDYNNVEHVGYKQWDARLKRIESHNLKKYGMSLSWSSMESWFSPCIIEINSSYKTLAINKKKYKLIMAYMKAGYNERDEVKHRRENLQ